MRLLRRRPGLETVQYRIDFTLSEEVDSSQFRSLIHTLSDSGYQMKSWKYDRRSGATCLEVRVPVSTAEYVVRETMDRLIGQLPTRLRETHYSVTKITSSSAG